MVDGYGSAEAIDYTGKDNSGGAYVLGDNEALGVLHEHIKDTLAHIAKTKIEQSKQMNQAANVPMTGALDSDIYKYILPAKTKLTDAVSQMQQRIANDKSYANTPQMFSDALAIKKQQDELRAMVAASANRKGIIDRDTQLYSANPGKYKDAEFIKRQAQMRSKHPLEDAGIDTNLLVPQFDRTKFVEDWKKIAGKETIKTQAGNEVTLQENPIYERDGKGKIKSDANGTPITTEFYKKFVEPNQEAHITKDAIAATIDDEGLQTDATGTAEDKAKHILKDQMNKVMDQRFEKEQKFKPDEGDEFTTAPKEGKYNVMVNAGTPDKPMETKMDYHRPFNTKKAVTVTNTTDIYDITTGKKIEGAPSTFKIEPSANVVFTTVGGHKMLATMGTMLNYTEKDFETVKDELWHDRVAKVDPMFKDIVDLKDPGTGHLKEIAEKNEPSDNDVINSMTRSGKLTKEKTVLVPLSDMKGSLEQQKINSSVDEKAFEKLQKSSSGKKTFTKADLAKKAKAAGYTYDEYYKLVKDKVNIQ